MDVGRRDCGWKGGSRPELPRVPRDDARLCMVRDVPIEASEMPLCRLSGGRTFSGPLLIWRSKSLTEGRASGGDRTVVTAGLGAEMAGNVHSSAPDFWIM